MIKFYQREVWGEVDMSRHISIEDSLLRDGYWINSNSEHKELEWRVKLVTV